MKGGAQYHPPPRRAAERRPENRRRIETVVVRQEYVVWNAIPRELTVAVSEGPIVPVVLPDHTRHVPGFRFLPFKRDIEALDSFPTLLAKTLVEMMLHAVRRSGEHYVVATGDGLAHDPARIMHMMAFAVRLYDQHQ
jgi:hypothetical protein